MTEQDRGPAHVAVEYDVSSDHLHLCISGAFDTEVLVFDFDAALNLNQKIASVCRQMKGSRVACAAVLTVATAEEKARRMR